MTDKEAISVIYHSLFNYSLTNEEKVRWHPGNALSIAKRKKNVVDREIKREPAFLQEKKKAIAVNAARTLSFIPSILFIGITGSLAMNNAKRESDIDLLIITRSGTLWPTRFISVVLLLLFGFKLRRAGNRDEADKLCLNMWLDETRLDLPQMPRNAYTAHEIAQTVPLINRDYVHERWVTLNKWIFDYWPNAIQRDAHQKPESPQTTLFDFMLNLLNPVFFYMEYWYMKPKVTRETVALSLALFHPYDWGTHVISLLKKHGIK